jgi:1-acyl-sn-glycerol-3-phosphate acyltransferase
VWKVTAEGRDRIPLEGPIIVAPTHESFLDPLLMGAYLPRGLRYMARRTLFVRVKDGRERRSRFLTWLGRVCYVIEVDREGGGREAVRACLDCLAQGDAVLIFPEGTRSEDGAVREFQPGVGMLALRSGAPVVPVSIDGTRRVWPRGRSRPRLGAGPVRLVYGEPVRYERPTKGEDAAADLRRRVLDLRDAGQRDAARDGAVPHGEAGGGPSG